MPYYCTVPRCTSMAGKAKNVSFHQFPRDEELAKLWNNILKRGKPYTKYSKVCSLHFTPQDYTITSVGKNKGQWRTLRKDAIPSQNLPSESPTPYQRKQWSTWSHGPNNIMDPAMQQQMAQAIYMQTMLAMQTSSSTDIATNGHAHQMESAPFPHTSNDTDILKGKHTNTNKHTYKCTECSKCFKDPDVFILHKRAHIKHEKNEKENFNLNLTLQANPILANLLKTNNEAHIFDNGALTVENLLMTALAANVEGYMRNLSAMIKNDGVGHDGNELANDRDGFSHDRGELDYKRDVDENDGSSDERDESYERDVVGRERDKDHERDVVGHDRDVVGHETDVVDYERDEVGHETDVVECERDEVGHERDGVDHELDGVGHERDSVAHDRNELDHDQDVLSSNGGEFYHSKDVGHQRNGLGHQRDGLSHKRDGLDHERDGLGHESLGLNHYITGSSHNGNPWNEYKSLEITAQNNHNRDEVNRDELYNHRGIFNSDNNSDINQVYKKTSKTIRYNDNGFDNSDNETDGYDNTDNDNIDNSRVICDREMNESIDSDSLVIDETI